MDKCAERVVAANKEATKKKKSKGRANDENETKHTGRGMCVLFCM